MALRRNDVVPDNCGPSGLVDVGLIGQPIVKQGTNRLSTDNAQSGFLIQSSGSVSPVSDFKNCSGAPPTDPFQPFFLPQANGRIMRAYLAKSGSDCFGPSDPLTHPGSSIGPGLGPNPNMSGLFVGSDPSYVDHYTIGTGRYVTVAGGTNPWQKPEFKGEQWRVIATLREAPVGNPPPNAGTIVLSGVIDDDGIPVGSGLNVAHDPGFGWYLEYFVETILEVVWTYELFGPFDPPPGLPGPINITYDYGLFYGCKGAWKHIDGVTPW